MRLRRVAFVLLFLSTVALNANFVGVSVNGVCEGGSCPATPIPVTSTATLPFDFTDILPNGDRYLIYGSFTLNGSSESNIFAFQVDYEGNASGGPSAADTITVERYAAFQASASSLLFNTELLGAFGPTIAASSSASTCFGGTLACLGPVSPPGSFNQSTTFLIPNVDGSYTDDKTFTNNFGAGSPVGSYIVWGRTAALPPPVPEPAYLVLLSLGLGGIISLHARRLRNEPRDQSLQR
jgi:hypothetical protein